MLLDKIEEQEIQKKSMKILFPELSDDKLNEKLEIIKTLVNAILSERLIDEQIETTPIFDSDLQ